MGHTYWADQGLGLVLNLCYVVRSGDSEGVKCLPPLCDTVKI